jgi:hypothetical protein
MTEATSGKSEADLRVFWRGEESIRADLIAVSREVRRGDLKTADASLEKVKDISRQMMECLRIALQSEEKPENQRETG